MICLLTTLLCLSGQSQQDDAGHLSEQHAAASTLIFEAATLINDGRYDEAISKADDADKLAKIVGDPDQIFKARALLAEIQQQTGDISGCLASLNELRQQVRLQGYNDYEIRCLLRLAEQASRCRCWPIALNFYVEAYQLAEETEDHNEVLGIALRLVQLHAKLSEFDAVQDVAESTRRYVDRHGILADKVRLLTVLTKIGEVTETDFGAFDELDRLVGSQRDLLPEKCVAHAMAVLGEVYLLNGDAEQAAARFEEALRDFDFEIHDRLVVRLRHAEALKDLGNKNEAIAITNDVLALCDQEDFTEIEVDALRLKAQLEDSDYGDADRLEAELRSEELKREGEFIAAWTALVQSETDKNARDKVQTAADSERARWIRILSLLISAISIVGTALFLRSRYQRRLGEDRERLAVEHGRNLEVRLIEQEKSLREQLQWRRSLERDLHRTERLETVGALTSGVAHDFNNLMTVVISATETIGMVAADRLEEREQEMLHEVLKAARSGAEITHQLLALTHSNELNEAVVIDVTAIFEDVLGLLKRTVGNAIEISVRTPDTPMLARVDRSQLTSALINLCSNARDAMDGCGQLDLSVGRVVDDGKRWIEIVVADTGCGMSPEHAAKACDLFFTTKAQGSGLGLNMVSKFVRRLEGELVITSRINEGSVVHLRMPAIGEDARFDSDHARLQQREIVEGLRVMVVDDKASVVSSVSTLLEDLGCAVTRFLNPEEAREALLTGHSTPDVVLSDIRMKGRIDGRDLSAWIQTERPNIAVILMTGHTGEEVDNVAVLRKPFATDELLTLLMEAVNGPKRIEPVSAAKAS